MREKLTNCDPSIYDRDTLMTTDGEFMNVDDIKERCICSHKSTCIELVKALEAKDFKKADQIMNRLIIEEDLSTTNREGKK